MPVWLRSVLAVLAGAVFIGVSHTVTDMVLEGAKLFAPMDPAYLAVAVVYRNVYNAIGGTLTGRIAPGAPQMHAAVLGGIGAVLNALGAAMMWSLGAHWYPIALILLALPCTWFGGWLASRRTA
jgi:hypothetical protein